MFDCIVRGIAVLFLIFHHSITDRKAEPQAPLNVGSFPTPLKSTKSWRSFGFVIISLLELLFSLNRNIRQSLWKSNSELFCPQQSTSRPLRCNVFIICTTFSMSSVNTDGHVNCNLVASLHCQRSDGFLFVQRNQNDSIFLCAVSTHSSTSTNLSLSSLHSVQNRFLTKNRPTTSVCK